MAKRPSFQFYPADWLQDVALRAVSAEARGLWADMLCLMHQGQPYGHLTLNQRPMPTAVLARIFGESLERTTALLEELSSAGIYSRTSNETIYSRRMVRDEETRTKRAEGGQLGGSPRLKKVRPKVRPKVQRPSNLAPRARARTSSSSSSASSSSSSASASSPSGNGVPSEHSSAGADNSVSIRQVFDHYRSYHPKAYPSPRSDSKEWRLIANRLKDGFTVADLCEAVDGAHRSPWHCGENPEGRKYQSLELIVRNGSKVSQFLEYATLDEPVVSQKEQKSHRAAQSWLNRSFGDSDDER